MDHLKHGGATPTFDVVAKTKEWLAASKARDGGGASFFADDYVFRGPIVGPISAKDVSDVQAYVFAAYPDLEVDNFGFCVDPRNPWRCLWFQRWMGTNTGDLKLGPLTMPPTEKIVETPLAAQSAVWNPAGKLVYLSISDPLDRFEGNTRSAAIIGLLEGAGAGGAGGPVGDLGLRFAQRLNQWSGFAGKTWSDDQDIPSWWKSKALGADPTDTKPGP